MMSLLLYVYTSSIKWSYYISLCALKAYSKSLFEMIFEAKFDID